MNLEHAKIASHNPDTEAITDVGSKQHTISNLLTGAINYWPSEALGFTHTMACVDIVLLRSDEANAIYREIVQACELPGYQAMLEVMLSYVLNRISKSEFKSQSKIETGPQSQTRPDAELHNNKNDTFTATKQAKTLKPVDLAIKRLEIKKPDDFPSDLKLLFQSDKLKQISEHPDTQYIMKRINELILVGFNRKIDQENKKWKVAPSHLLIRAISWRSIAEYCEIRFKDQVNDKIFDFDYKLFGRHTTRKERLIKKLLVQVFKHAGLVLHHDEKQLKDADQWYKCRVNPGTIEEYLNESAKDSITLERSNVETAIAPYDEATEYPRKWRK